MIYPTIGNRGARNGARLVVAEDRIKRETGSSSNAIGYELGTRVRGNMAIHTVVVDGPLALRMRRLDAAREGAIGRQILTLPSLAARLAGGFIVSASREELYPAIRQALDAGGFEVIGKVSGLPGMPHWPDKTWLMLSSIPMSRHCCRRLAHRCGFIATSPARESGSPSSP